MEHSKKNSNYNGVKYSPLKIENNNENNQDAKGSSSFAKTLKFVALIVLVIILFTCTTWAFKGPTATKEDFDYYSYESHRKTAIIFKKPSTGHKVKLVENANGTHNRTETLSTNTQGTVQAAPDIINPVNVDEIPTVFSSLHSTFDDLQLGEDNAVPTLQFMQICADLKPLLGAIGSSVSLIEGDLKGNAEKLQKVYDENQAKCQNLQDMLLFDIKMGKAEMDDRSVVALTWLKRAYTFIEEFLSRIGNGQEPTDAARAAYDNTLSKHHSWYVRGIFKVGVSILPNRDKFLIQILINEGDMKKPAYEEKVVADMQRYLEGMRHIFGILRDFYTDNGLEN